MDTAQINLFIAQAISAALEGGKAILEVYESDFAIEHKEDKSPLTQADKNAHEKIMELLASTELPVLSEEGKSIPFEERNGWAHFWMVDPLDGTKEFIKRNGEFTVNIALIEGNYPIGGVIYVPVKKDLYFAHQEIGAFKVEEVPPGASEKSISDWMEAGKKLPASGGKEAFVMVGSRSHMSPETLEFMEQMKARHGEVEVISMGSSLKICLVAEGIADAYPRFAPTMEWDTAAGQAIAEGAGRVITAHSTGQRMQYNKEDLLNDWFLVAGA